MASKNINERSNESLIIDTWWATQSQEVIIIGLYAYVPLPLWDSLKIIDITSEEILPESDATYRGPSR